MKKLENLLAANMRRFGTKNLNEDDAMADSDAAGTSTEYSFITKLVNDRSLYPDDDVPNHSVYEFKQLSNSFSDLIGFYLGNSIKYVGVFNKDKYDPTSNELYAKFIFEDYPEVYIKLFAGGKCFMHAKPAVKWWGFGGGEMLKYGAKRKFPAEGKTSVMFHKSKHDPKYAGKPGFDPKKKK